MQSSRIHLMQHSIKEINVFRRDYRLDEMRGSGGNANIAQPCRQTRYAQQQREEDVGDTTCCLRDGYARLITASPGGILERLILSY